jgi:hypothetical protein
MSETATKETTIDVEPTAEGQIMVREQTNVAPMSQDDAAAGIAVQMATAAIEMSRRKSGEIDVDALREIRGMAKELRDEGRLQWFSRDMSAAQAEMQPVVRNAEVKLSKPGEADKGGYKYADLEAIDEMLRPIRTKYGFSITSDRLPRQGDGGGFVIVSTLWHRSGHHITASFPLPLDSGPGRNNLQAAGSTDSYGRKYNALAFFDIVRKNADDDGVAAGGEPVTRDQAARLVQLVEEAGIASGDTEEERKANRKKWFAENLSYEIDAFTKIRKEDYARLARLLKSLGDNRKEAEAAKVAV